MVKQGTDIGGDELEINFLPIKPDKSAYQKRKFISSFKFLSMTIHQLQSEVDQWVKTNGVRYFSELSNTAILAEECGEVSRLMARLYGDQSFKSADDAASARVDLAGEMADVIFVLTCLANQCGIDLEQAIIHNMEFKKKRDTIRHQTNPKLKS